MSAARRALGPRKVLLLLLSSSSPPPNIPGQYVLRKAAAVESTRTDYLNERMVTLASEYYSLQDDL